MVLAFPELDVFLKYTVILLLPIIHLLPKGFCLFNEVVVCYGRTRCLFSFCSTIIRVQKQSYQFAKIHFFPRLLGVQVYKLMASIFTFMVFVFQVLFLTETFFTNIVVKAFNTAISDLVVCCLLLSFFCALFLILFFTNFALKIDKFSGNRRVMLQHKSIKVVHVLFLQLWFFVFFLDPMFDVDSSACKTILSYLLICMIDQKVDLVFYLFSENFILFFIVQRGLIYMTISIVFDIDFLRQLRVCFSDFGNKRGIVIDPFIFYFFVFFLVLDLDVHQ